jgi:AAA ATPase domain
VGGRSSCRMTVANGSAVNVGAVTSDGRMELLERSREVEALDASYGAVSATSHGRLVLVAGEAGVGKTVLLRRFCERCGGRALWGSCEPLFTPRPLGPLLDVAELTGGDLAAVVAAGDRPHEVVVALIRELRRRTPAVLVLEDLHWATKRPSTSSRCSPAGSPMCRPWCSRATATTSWTARIPCRPCWARSSPPSRSAACGSCRSPRRRSRRWRSRTVSTPTRCIAGRPATPSSSPRCWARRAGEIPPTVRDAVLARMARLRPAARTLLDAAAIAPPPRPPLAPRGAGGPRRRPPRGMPGRRNARRGRPGCGVPARACAHGGGGVAPGPCEDEPAP